MEAPILYEVIVEEELFQIEDVPALVCRDCGQQWVEREVQSNIEAIIRENAGSSPH